MGPTWGSPRADRTKVGPMLAPWTFLSGMFRSQFLGVDNEQTPNFRNGQEHSTDGFFNQNTTIFIPNN